VGANDSLLKDVGQLLWVGFPGLEVDPALRKRIAAGHVGAAILFRRNIALAGDGSGRSDPAAVAALNASLREAAGDSADPLLIAVDQEGGRVQRVKDPVTVWSPMLGLSRVAGEEGLQLATDVGKALGRELAALGFDIDFAPVLDVHTNDENPIIGDRAFATDPQRAAELALAFADGLHSVGVLSCGKHFPGHGDTRTDSHLELPSLPHSLDRLEQVELLPFRRAAKAGLPILMTAHIVFSAIDPDRPATLSPAVLNELLRNDIGYTGLVVSDDLDMKAIADNYGTGDAAVAAVEAGCDALLACNDLDTQHAIFDALVRAGEQRAPFRARLGEAAAAVRTLKQRHFSVERPAFGLDVVGTDAHRQLAERLAAAE